MNTKELVRKVAEKPILFSGEMVQAILDGRKTQTRRVMKPQLHTGKLGDVYIYPKDNAASEWSSNPQMFACDCPYGVPGDRLWVREAFQRVEAFYGLGILYRSDESILAIDFDAPNEWERTNERLHEPRLELHDIACEGMPWCPSIHMPRWASRITLEITNVRVERLNEISAEDVVAEGIDLSPIWENSTGVTYEEVAKVWTQNVPRNDGESIDQSYSAHFIACFKRMWDKINGKKNPWASNPWVWVIEFKKLEADI